LSGIILLITKTAPCVHTDVKRAGPIERKCAHIGKAPAKKLMLISFSSIPFSKCAIAWLVNSLKNGGTRAQENIYFIRRHANNFLLPTKRFDLSARVYLEQPLKSAIFSLSAASHTTKFPFSHSSASTLADCFSL